MTPEDRDDLQNQIDEAISTAIRSEGYNIDRDSVHVLIDKVMEVVVTNHDSAIYQDIVGFMRTLGMQAVDKAEHATIRKIRAYIKACGYDWKAFHEFGVHESRRMEIARMFELNEELREAYDARSVLLKLRGKYADVKESKELNKTIEKLEKELSRLASTYPEHAPDLAE